ncbi:hypothetical protein VTP01DRAFT_6849 [Rhizomucor pusillus]|uniref:uncharacterized protein n=1 Tax=Rhizomucor pusillus TaxID=4840 RepID=UPI0037420D47
MKINATIGKIGLHKRNEPSQIVYCEPVKKYLSTAHVKETSAEQYNKQLKDYEDKELADELKAKRKRAAYKANSGGLGSAGLKLTDWDFSGDYSGLDAFSHYPADDAAAAEEQRKTERQLLYQCLCIKQRRKRNPCLNRSSKALKLKESKKSLMKVKHLTRGMWPLADKLSKMADGVTQATSGGEQRVSPKPTITPGKAFVPKKFNLANAEYKVTYLPQKRTDITSLRSPE